jgi:hypothetical protein
VSLPRFAMPEKKLSTYSELKIAVAMAARGARAAVARGAVLMAHRSKEVTFNGNRNDETHRQ